MVVAVLAPGVVSDQTAASRLATMNTAGFAPASISRGDERERRVVRREHEPRVRQRPPPVHAPRRGDPGADDVRMVTRRGECHDLAARGDAREQERDRRVAGRIADLERGGHGRAGRQRLAEPADHSTGRPGDRAAERDMDRGTTVVHRSARQGQGPADRQIHGQRETAGVGHREVVEHRHARRQRDAYGDARDRDRRGRTGHEVGGGARDRVVDGQAPIGKVEGAARQGQRAGRDDVGGERHAGWIGDDEIEGRQRHAPRDRLSQ